MSKVDKYQELFTKEFLMGPNSMRLLEEMLEKSPVAEGLRILDLGCGKGLTSLFLAKEAKVQVFATDLWISATENYNRFEQWGITDSVIPIHADAKELPYAEGYFDAVVSIDSFHYFATQPGFLETKLLPLVKSGGKVIVAMPGLKEELHGKETQLILDWVNGEKSEFELFHSREWWKNHWGNSSNFEIMQEFDLDNFAIAWKEWFESGHPFAARDEEFFQKGVEQYLAIIGFVIEKK